MLTRRRRPVIEEALFDHDATQQDRVDRVEVPLEDGVPRTLRPPVPHRPIKIGRVGRDEPVDGYLHLHDKSSHQLISPPLDPSMARHNRRTGSDDDAVNGLARPGWRLKPNFQPKASATA